MKYIKQNAIIFLALPLLFLSFTSQTLYANVRKTTAISPFGMNAGLSTRFRDNPVDRIRAAQLLNNASVGWIREEFAWEAIEPNPHQVPRQYRWQVEGYFDYDQALRLASENNTEVLGLLTYGPRTNINNGTVYNAPGLPPPLIPDAAPISDWLPAWRDYVREVVSRYGEQIDYWEIQNEPNSIGFWRKVDLRAEYPNATDYVQVLRAACEVIREINPNDKIVLGGLSYEGQGIDYYDYLQKIYSAGGWRYFDILAIHPYRWPAFPEQVRSRSKFNVQTLQYEENWIEYNYTDEIVAFKDLMRSYREKPIWITEIGWPIAALVQRANERGTLAEIVQSDYLIRVYIQSIAAGVDNIFWYDFRDDYWVVDDPNESSFGIIRADLSPKPAYYGFAVMASLLNNSLFVEQVRGQNDRNRPGDDDVYEYRFANDAQTIIVLWKSQGGDVPRTITVENILATTVQVLGPDFTSNISRTMDCPNGTISLELTERPIFVVYSAPTFWEKIKIKVTQWFEEQKQKAEAEFNKWWEEQRVKFQQWWEEETEKLVRQIEIEIERQLAQLCGTAMLPIFVVCITTVIKKRCL